MDSEIPKARLTVQQAGNDLLQVGLAGDWITESHLPSFDPVAKGFAAGRVKALEFDTANLGRWNSGLMTFVLKCYDSCKQSNAEFRAETLPAGVAKLLEPSQAVPEKKDAARGKAKSPFFQRLDDKKTPESERSTSDTSMRATVMAIDRENRTVTLKFENGETDTLSVRKDTDLSLHHEGERLLFRTTEMTVIRIEKP
jgi:hypothetical protein